MLRALAFICLSSLIYFAESTVEFTTIAPENDDENTTWRWKTIMVFVAIALWILITLIGIAISIPKLIEDRRVIKARIEAKKRATSFKRKDPHSLVDEPLLSGSMQQNQSQYSYEPKFSSNYRERKTSELTDYENGYQDIDNYNPRGGSSRPTTYAKRYDIDGLNVHLDQVAQSQNSHAVQINNFYRMDDEFSDKYDDPPPLRGNFYYGQ